MGDELTDDSAEVGSWGHHWDSVFSVAAEGRKKANEAAARAAEYEDWKGRLALESSKSGGWIAEKGKGGKNNRDSLVAQNSDTRAGSPFEEGKGSTMKGRAFAAPDDEL